MAPFLAAVLLLCATLPVGDSTKQIDTVVVYKQQRKLVLLSHGREVKSYRVALGTEPLGPKMRQGDHRTPRRQLRS
jgi:murein L,D-transpeptidase YafK